MARRPLDYYPTKAAEFMVQPLVRSLARMNPDFVGERKILEPCCGKEIILGKALQDTSEFLGSYLSYSDIDETQNVQYEEYFETYDATTDKYWRSIDCCDQKDWIITNPPFNVANEILEHAFLRAKYGVAFLLRLTYLEPTRNRFLFLSKYACCLRKIIVFGQPRPNFLEGEINPKTGKEYSGDSVTTAWFIWIAPEHLNSISPKEPFYEPAIEWKKNDKQLSLL